MSLREELFGSPGYSLQYRLLPDELIFMRREIAEQMRKRVSEAFSEHKQNGSHQELWGRKNHRLFTQAAVERVKEFNFLKFVGYELGAWRLSPVIYEGGIYRDKEEVYWRLVRPHHETDVGGLHADSWYLDHFKDAQGPLIGEKEYTLKCWIPIEVEPGLNGLEVVPDSHSREWRTQTTQRPGLSRPHIEIDEPVRTRLLSTKPGNVVIFNDKLLHGGVVNRGEHSRVSAEITLVLQR